MADAPPRYRTMPDGKSQGLLCSAHSKRTKQLCQAFAVAGHTVCKTHGGFAVAGPAHPNYKTGRWSKFMPLGKQAEYDEFRLQPGMLSLEDEIALIDLRIAEQLRRAADGASWSAVKGTYDTLMAGLQSGDTAALNAAVGQLGELVTTGSASDIVWRDILKLTDRRRRLVESERKYRIERDAFLTRDQVHAYGHALLTIITRHVKDRTILLNIIADFRVIAAMGNAGPRSGPTPSDDRPTLDSPTTDTTG